MGNELSTETGDNWSTFFFECPASDFKRILTDLFSFLEATQEAQIPHFLVREYALTQKLGISLRILRKPTESTMVETKICTFFEKNNLKYETEPEGNRHT